MPLEDGIIMAEIAATQVIQDFAIIMKEFAEGRRVVLQDNLLQREVTVNIVEGIPFCNECRSNDCAHVGFAICAEQMTNKSKIE